MHLRTGDLILSGVFPDQEIFSFTAAGKPWMLHEWGSQVIFIALYNLFGPAGLITLRALIVALTIRCMFLLLSRKGIHLFLALGLTLVAGLLFFRIWGIRPHIFSLLFLTLTISIYNEYSEHSRPGLLAWLPVIFLLWINLHGAFFVTGVAFLGLCLIGEALNFIIDRGSKGLVAHLAPLAFWSAMAFLAGFANPNTYQGVLFPIQLFYGNESVLPLLNIWISECHPTSFLNSRGFLYFNFFVIGIFAFSSMRLKPGHFILVLVFGLFAFRYNRLTPFYVAIIIPLLATHCQEFITRGWHAGRNLLPELFQKGKSLFNYMQQKLPPLEIIICRPGARLLPITLMIVYSLLLFSGKISSILPADLNQYRAPMKNIALLRSYQPPGNLFNEFRWGGLIAWTLPGKKIFIDGRVEVYGNDIAEEYQTVLLLRNGWQHILEKYNITHILTLPYSPLSRYITSLDKSWFLVSDDGVSRLFFKNTRMDAVLPQG